MVEVMSQFNNTGAVTENSKMLFGEYLWDWYEKKKKSISPQTQKLYEVIIRVHVAPKLGDIPLNKLTAFHIESFTQHLIDDKGLKPESIRRIISVINTSLNAAERLDLVTKNVARAVEKPKIPHRELKVWEPEYVAEFLEKIKGMTRYYAAIYLAIMTGMRQGEILGLRWSDIDFETGVLRIQQTLTHNGKKLVAGAKTTGSVRSITLSPETLKVLKEHRQMIVQERVALGSEYKNHDLVNPTSLGTPVSGRGILKVWNRLMRETKAPRVTFHDLRHTHASLLLKQGVHIKIVSERLGHSSVAITLDRYSHLMPNMQGEAAKGLDNLLFGTRK
ncbi:site-specific recombinase XerD [Paenibacillus methanolicus]|uniref:Site-specific recombinase XerD n=2 Tax=Paenibacillus methanolicus TaxID=582686 RepID=A0A5S5BU69_9BACL|nr:site-specific recombinase XerD [Paenibacillus methanolicus]